MRLFLKFICSGSLLAFTLSMGQCISISIPPIVITGTKTASEKQIVGEVTELGKDAWMVSSAKTTTEVSMNVESKLDQAGQNKMQGIASLSEENTITYKGFAILDTFGPELNSLKKDGVVGENNSGLLTNLLNVENVEIADDIRGKYNPKAEGNSAKILQETVKQINQARLYLAEGYIISQKRINPEFNPDKMEIVKSQKSKYQAAAQKGEYIQLDSGEWTQKK